MIGLEDIAVYVPERYISNLELLKKFDISESFLTEKIGVLKRAIKHSGEDTSDMALKALKRLISKAGIDKEELQCLIVVTQNPDSNLPHVSGIVHGKAELPSSCAVFDISLGCSGYVYGLSILLSFLKANQLCRGVLITCDPYSKVIDVDDKNTALLFGDAATATLIGPSPVMICSHFMFGTQGDLSGALTCQNGKLKMKGREVFNFAARVIPESIKQLCQRANICKEEVDCFIFHQGSRYLIETLIKRIGLEEAKVLFDIEQVGNTVSSSIPLLLEKKMLDSADNIFVLSGFGVGLSWANCLCRRTERNND